MIRIPVKKTSKPFELVHSDLCGPFKHPMKGGARYNMIFIDDYSRSTTVYFLPNKQTETCTAVFQAFDARMKALRYKLRRFRCDNGRGQYVNNLFRAILQTEGISFEPLPPYTQHKNGVSERMIETITEKARALMIESQAPIQFWGKAVNTASYLRQRTPSAALNGKTPYEVRNRYGKPEKDENGKPIDFKASLHHLRRFGCYVYKRIPKEQRIDSKIGTRSKLAMMVGYVHDSTTLCRVYNFHHQKVVQWSDAVFDEERNAHMSCSMAPNEKEETEDPFGLPEGEPTQVEYTEEDDTSEISTEACQRSGSDAPQSSGSDIDPSVHTECRSKNIRQEEAYPE